MAALLEGVWYPSAEDRLEADVRESVEDPRECIMGFWVYRRSDILEGEIGLPLWQCWADSRS